MEIDYFLLQDKIKEIESSFLIKNGWLKIYENLAIDIDDSLSVYCCLISNDKVEDYNKNHSWPILKGSEGKPSVYGDNTYKTYDEEGLEPFLFCKNFSLIDSFVDYVDISEEFIMYFKLYEKGADKKNRNFFYVDEYGELDEVITVEPNLIKIKIKYLKEYISIRKMNFVICFDYMRLMSKIPSDWKIEFKDELVQKPNIIYSHLIRNVLSKTQSWILGKVFIKPNEQIKTHYDLDISKNEEFIVGINDTDGELLYEDCSKTDGNLFKVTYFKKEVLDKYYNEPNKYTIDGFSVSSKFFRLKIDNNVSDYVPVFLTNLRVLSHKEQLHWKQYNIPPNENMNISRTYYTTMIEGNWVENNEAIDLFFKSKYEEFNSNWEKKFGWKLYKPLSERDEYLFKSLHIITSNNIKAFCEQTLSIVKLTIDRLNEQELGKGLNLDENTKGIGKFEKFIEKNKMRIPDMFVFLRNLQNLRSGLIAHSFSETNKSCKNSIQYFDIKDDNLIKVSEDIFVKSIFTLNTLEKLFKLKE